MHLAILMAFLGRRRAQTGRRGGCWEATQAGVCHGVLSLGLLVMWAHAGQEGSLLVSAQAE